MRLLVAPHHGTYNITLKKSVLKRENLVILVNDDEFCSEYPEDET